MRITFQINLLNPDLFATSLPFQPPLTATDIANTVSTWISNRLGGNHQLKHGDLLTVEGFDAVYFKNNFDAGVLNFLTLIDTATATATATMLPVGIPVVVAPGAGYSIGVELTLTGGTSTEAGKILIDSVATVLGQDETNYSAGEDEGTFSGGTSYSVSDTITMSDGTVVVVDSVSVGVITGFTVTSISTVPHTSNGDTITQSFTSSEGGTGFSMTLGLVNQGAFSASYKQSAGVNLGKYTALPSDPVATTGPFPGGATFNVDWGVRTVAITDGGDGYFSAPGITFAGGSGTVATSALTGDAVSSITVTAFGSGYNSVATVTVAPPP
jgi:hypothetical protein